MSLFNFSKINMDSKLSIANSFDRYFKIIFIFVSLAIVITLFSNQSYARARYTKINVPGPLKTELNKVLKATNGLHSACVGSIAEPVDNKINQVIDALKKTSLKASFAKEQKPHLLRMTEAARVQLELTLNRTGEKRKTSLKEAFNHLVQIAKVYKLDDYKIFFCPSDKAVWLQKSSAPKNPINPKKYGTCGKLVL